MEQKRERDLFETHSDSDGSSSPRPKKEKVGPKSEFPAELWNNILDFLSVADIVNCRLVCTSWRNLADREALWRKISHECFGYHSCDLIRPMGTKWRDVASLLAQRVGGEYKTESILCTVGNEIPEDKFFAYSISFSLTSFGNVKRLLDGLLSGMIIHGNGSVSWGKFRILGLKRGVMISLSFLYDNGTLASHFANLDATHQIMFTRWRSTWREASGLSLMYPADVDKDRFYPKLQASLPAELENFDNYNDYFWFQGSWEVHFEFDKKEDGNTKDPLRLSWNVWVKCSQGLRGFCNEDPTQLLVGNVEGPRFSLSLSSQKFIYSTLGDKVNETEITGRFSRSDFSTGKFFGKKYEKPLESFEKHSVAPSEKIN